MCERGDDAVVTAVFPVADWVGMHISGVWGTTCVGGKPSRDLRVEKTRKNVVWDVESKSSQVQKNLPRTIFSHRHLMVIYEQFHVKSSKNTLPCSLRSHMQR